MVEQYINPTIRMGTSGSVVGKPNTVARDGRDFKNFVYTKRADGSAGPVYSRALMEQSWAKNALIAERYGGWKEWSAAGKPSIDGWERYLGIGPQGSKMTGEQVRAWASRNRKNVQRPQTDWPRQQPFSAMAPPTAGDVMSTTPGVMVNSQATAPAQAVPVVDIANAAKTSPSTSTTTMDMAQPLDQAKAAMAGVQSTASPNPPPGQDVAKQAHKRNTQFRSQRSGYQGNRRFNPFSG